LRAGSWRLISQLRERSGLARRFIIIDIIMATDDAERLRIMLGG
jgi:hypothetical protein